MSGRVNRVLTPAQREEIILLRAGGIKGAVIARRLGVTNACVCKVWRAHEKATAKPEARPAPAERERGPGFGIPKVARRIVDRASIASWGPGKDYGFVTISLPRVSLIDGPLA